MPRFNYIAKPNPRKTIQASLEAESKQDAINKLNQMGYFPVAVEPEVAFEGKPAAWHFRRNSRKDLVLFTRQLATLVGSGINIVNGINIVSTQTPSKYLKSILSDVVSKVKDGKPLSESMAIHPYLFPPLYCAMIGIGESSGNLNNILRRLADFLEKEEEFKNSLRSSLTYPAFIFSVSILTVFVLVAFVIPRLAMMFEDMGQVLPLPTKFLIGLSGYLHYYWWIIITIFALCALLLYRFQHSPQGKILWDRLKLKPMFFGQVILKNEISRFSRTLSLLLSSGISIAPALEISLSVIDNRIFKNEVQGFKQQITGGLSLSNALGRSKFFPGFVRNIVAIGEETGSLDKSLLSIAEDYEREVDRKIKALMRLLEPVIILIMGLIVGFIVLSMLLPIFQINLIVR